MRPVRAFDRDCASDGGPAAWPEPRRDPDPGSSVLIRPEVQAFLDAGPLPSEDEATEEQLVMLQAGLKGISRPVTDDEAQWLATAFGPDNCYGLSWSLLHLIETAPGARDARYTRADDGFWPQMLAARVRNAR
jgi:hypothetical protein